MWYININIYHKSVPNRAADIQLLAENSKYFYPNKTQSCPFDALSPLELKNRHL